LVWAMCSLLSRSSLHTARLCLSFTRTSKFPRHSYNVLLLLFVLIWVPYPRHFVYNS
jgi:hypothetical protein